MSAFAPNAHLVAPVWNWGIFYKEIVEQVKGGTWESKAHWWGLDKGIVDLSPMSDMVPKAVREKVLAKKADLSAGKAKVFVGPVKDQKGEVRIPAGQAASDESLLGMNWFVHGVIGTTE
jgi:basic membrane protein A